MIEIYTLSYKWLSILIDEEKDFLMSVVLQAKFKLKADCCSVLVTKSYTVLLYGYLSNRQHFLSVYRLINLFGMLREHEKVCRSLGSGS